MNWVGDEVCARAAATKIGRSMELAMILVVKLLS
jgi:hypothetical protein